MSIIVPSDPCQRQETLGKFTNINHLFTPIQYSGTQVTLQQNTGKNLWFSVICQLKAIVKKVTEGGNTFDFKQTKNISLNNKSISPKEQSRSKLSVTGTAALKCYQIFILFLTSYSTVLSMKLLPSWLQYSCSITRYYNCIPRRRKGKNKSLCLFIQKDALFMDLHLCVIGQRSEVSVWTPCCPNFDCYPSQNLGVTN